MHERGVCYRQSLMNTEVQQQGFAIAHMDFEVPSRTMGSPVRALVSTPLRAPATTATLTALYLVLIALPVGGQPTGTWTTSPFRLQVPTSGLEWDPNNTNPCNVKTRVGINSSCCCSIFLIISEGFTHLSSDENHTFSHLLRCMYYCKAINGIFEAVNINSLID